MCALNANKINEYWLFNKMSSHNITLKKTNIQYTWKILMICI